MQALTLMYVAAIIASFLPWTAVIRSYSRRVDLDSLIDELKEVAERLSKTPSRKEKKLRILKARYKALRGKINRFFFMNIFTLWIGIFTSLMFARSLLYYSLTHLHMHMPPSPLNLPGISVNGKLNDLILYIATIIGYMYFHNNVAGVNKMRRLREVQAA